MIEFTKTPHLSTLAIGRTGKRHPVYMSYSHLYQGSFGFNINLFARYCPLHFGITIGRHCFYVQLFARFEPVLP